MSERELHDLVRKLKSAPSYTEASTLLSKTKLTLLKLKALTPQPETPQTILLLAREAFENGALLSIRAKDTAAFTRYVHSQRTKVTGLYLLLLLTQGDYAGFHTELEGLEIRGEGEAERDRYLGYPIKLERWLMEGSYDQVWKAMASRDVPSEEYGVFSEVNCYTFSFDTTY
jgi:26S proteasome regulatory subunit N12